MANSTVQLNLPDETVAILDSVRQSGAYDSDSAYVSELIARDHAERERVRALIIEGMNSGVAGTWSPGFASRLLQETREEASQAVS